MWSQDFFPTSGCLGGVWGGTRWGGRTTPGPPRPGAPQHRHQNGRRRRRPPQRPDGQTRPAARQAVRARSGVGHGSGQRLDPGGLRRRGQAARGRRHRDLAADAQQRRPAPHERGRQAGRPQRPLQDRRHDRLAAHRPEQRGEEPRHPGQRDPQHGRRHRHRLLHARRLRHRGGLDRAERDGEHDRRELGHRHGRHRGADREPPRQRHGLRLLGLRHPHRKHDAGRPAQGGHGTGARELGGREPPEHLGRLHGRGDDQHGQVPARLPGLRASDVDDGRDARHLDQPDRKGGPLMSTRITQSMISSRVLTDLQDVSSRLSQTQEKLSSGKELTKPSDDPFATSKALSLSNDLEGTQQYERTVNDAQAWTGMTETTLGSINSAAQRARALLVQAGNDTNDTTDRSAIADEIDQLIEQVKGDANAQYGGQDIMSGGATTTAPYTVGGTPPDDSYHGNTGGIYRQIGPGVSVQINTPGASVLGSGRPGGGGLYTTLRTISPHLRSATTADADSLRTTDLKALDSSLDAVSSARAVNGATTNRLSSASDRLSQLEQSTTSLLSDTQDADMAQTMIDFSMQQTVYQSALRAGANIVQASLLDFLS